MQVQENKENTEKMWELFEQVWKEVERGYRRHCESCGAQIWGEIRSLYFHHLLPKGVERYEHLKLEKENIMFLCSTCHTKTESGYAPWNVQQRTEEAHKRFGV